VREAEEDASDYHVLAPLVGFTYTSPMPWTYNQSTGILTDPAGHVVGTGYSGHGAGVNNPTLQNQRDVGPIPQGSYTIGPAYHDSHRGPNAMRLTPVNGTRTFGRDGFLIHADNRHQNHTASEGCIILRPALRDRIAHSADRTINVTR